MHLIAQPCAIMIRGAPKRLDTPCPDSHPRVHLPPTPRPQWPLGTSYRAIIIPGQPSTCPLGTPLVRPHINRFSPARCGPKPVTEQCETLPTGARSSSTSSEASWESSCRVHLPAPPAKYITLLTCAPTLASLSSLFRGARLPRLQPSRLFTRFPPHGCCFYYGHTIYDNRHGRQCRLSDPRLHLYH